MLGGWFDTDLRDGSPRTGVVSLWGCAEGGRVLNAVRWDLDRRRGEPGANRCDRARVPGCAQPGPQVSMHDLAGGQAAILFSQWRAAVSSSGVIP